MTIKPCIAQRLLSLRLAAGLTQSALATAAGISRQLLRKIEAGQMKSPRFADVAKLCKVLGISLSEFDGMED